MAERVTRPSTRLTQSVYQQLFHDGLSLSKLRDAVARGRLLQSSDGAIGVPGRSLAWKLFLLKAEPLDSPPDEVPSMPIELLRGSRKQFSQLLLEKMRAPDGSYDESFVVPGFAIPRRSRPASTNLETNNPLSLHDEVRDASLSWTSFTVRHKQNPWKEWFSAVELRKTIQQDVERTFPDMGYFRNEDVQHQLTNVLFLYSVMHPEIGYRQGMHELLAPLFYSVDFDSTAESLGSGLDSLFLESCSRSWVAADSWALFSAMMRGISHWYEWREPDRPSSSSRGPMNLKPFISPIIQTCNIIQGTLLKSVDPVLHDAMQSAGVEPQLYGLRWLRLLFTREFPMNEAMMLWDGLFASSSAIPDLVHWICVAMLIRIRTKLIPSDYSSQLMHLLRYPPCPTPEEGAPHHIPLLIRQATALEMSHTPSAGASLAVENRNLLNIPLEVPDPPPVVRRRARPIDRAHQASPSEHLLGGPSPENLRQQPSFQLGFPELIARGLLDRGESLGINKTVMNAVSELKRNLPDLASTLARSPSFGGSSFAAYPLLDEKPPTERYTWDHRSGLESASELAELRQQNKHLGEAVARILEILNRGEDDQGHQEAYGDQRKQSLESLSYVRDVLSGQVAEVDERRLWGEEEFKRRWEIREKSQSVAHEAAVSGREGREVMRSSGGASSPSLSLDNRRFSPNTSVSSSVNGPLRSFISSSSSGHTTRATSLGTTTHNRSQSSGALFSSRPTLPQRAPVRTSANNPFQRVSNQENASRPATTGQGDQSPKVRSEVQHDPLGVLK